MKMNNNKILEKDNWQTARFVGKEVCIKVVSLRTETLYKADAMGRGQSTRESRSSSRRGKERGNATEVHAITRGDLDNIRCWFQSTAKAQWCIQ